MQLIFLVIFLFSAQPSRDHIFHISFPSVWKQSDIVNHFRQFGNVYITWLTDTTAYVALIQRENAVIVLKKIGYTEGVKILTFKDFKVSQTKVRQATLDNKVNNNKRKITSPETFKNSASPSAVGGNGRYKSVRLIVKYFWDLYSIPSSLFSFFFSSKQKKLTKTDENIKGTGSKLFNDSGDW